MAWRMVSGNAAEPRDIEAFQEDRYETSGRKSFAYRLRGVGPAGGSIVAKKGHAAPIGVARCIYQHIMPGLGGYSLGFLGDLPSPSDDMWWIFLEDAGEEKLDTSRPEDRLVAAQWLAALHLHTADWSGELPLELPSRTCDSYRRNAVGLSELLERARTCVEHDAGHVRVLDTLAPLVVRLCRDWRKIEEACAGLPRVLVHGDLIDKNMRLARGRIPDHEVSMLGIDWEMAGWGTPAVDLGSTRIGEDPESLQEYYNLVRHRWPGVSLDALHAAARAGVAIRTVMSIEWALGALGRRYVERQIGKLSYYAGALADFLHS